MLISIFQILYILLSIIWWIIVIQAVMSWLIAFNVINTHNDLVRSIWQALDKITEPLYRPIRKILPDFGGIDFSPIVLILAIQILRKLNQGLALETSATLM